MELAQPFRRVRASRQVELAIMPIMIVLHGLNAAPQSEGRLRWAAFFHAPARFAAIALPLSARRARLIVEAAFYRRLLGWPREDQ